MKPLPCTGPRVGCCGFPLKHAECYRRFDAIEVQHTFYQPPQRATLERWRAEAPPQFEFTLKAWQLITHEPSSPTYRRLGRPVPENRRTRYGAFRSSDEVESAWRTTLDCVRALAARVVVFQCPATFTPTDEHVANLRGFFTRARAVAPDLVFVWEPRGDWPRRTVEALCEELRLIHVVDPFKDRPGRKGLRYFRLHGRAERGYRYDYSDSELEELATYASGTTYFMFNNYAMARNAERLAQLVGRVGIEPTTKGL